MYHSHMLLGTNPLKIARDTTLLQNQKCIVKAAAGTLTLPIVVDDAISGQFFLGKGQLALDTIIETEDGAIGKPLIRDLTPDCAFVMLGDNRNLKETLVPASEQDLRILGYNSADEFLKRANEAFDGFTHRQHSEIDIKPNAHIFAFANENEKWDVLIAKDDELVYASKHKVYIFKNDGESASVEPRSILVARHGKTVAIIGAPSTI